METLMEMAKKGDCPEWLKDVAKSEGIEVDKLLRLIARGEVVVPKNVNRELKKPRAIGRFVSTKINANVGTSIDYVNVEEEVEKAIVAQKYGADAIMDLSTAGDLDFIRRKIMEVTEVPFGTVPIYQSARMKKVVVDMDEDDFFKSVEKQAKDGVDFMTIHAGVNRFTLEVLKKSGRLLGIVSRGGAIIVGWMVHNEKENPYYKDFDYLLEILKEYDVTISLGDAFRPGCLHDSDRAKYAEWIVLGELVEKCREKGVQCMVEGPGHMPADQIIPAVKAMKVITRNAPLYLLGPLVTDIALGYDHIAGAMGALVAGLAGADFICYLTPAEHLALPTVEDVKEGVIVTKIAAHAIDLVKEGVRERAMKVDYEMSLARKNFDWDRQFELAIDPEKAKKIWERRKSQFACSMCGDLCAIKLAQKALERNVFNPNHGQSEG
ncbi:phosphomethylpyrimidine synthase [Archaeoglobus profundus]|uniref:Phosphomethylpyrimidine synthase n=1 Tax=Archaeoglobus profundus (strain DSM 5631 / JCM 9629 / NBRC 100127 / Av18) TaxID=572546 RepID=D2RF92_ARCPA|nr:phosphomethylpyrimidine synthase [Archaeoglobus profundus]ADB58786.1 thiamine biosynthesis protein ThiC [Archaeoglobus profundus DSM 5631]